MDFNPRTAAICAAIYELNLKRRMEPKKVLDSWNIPPHLPYHGCGQGHVDLVDGVVVRMAYDDTDCEAGTFGISIEHGEPCLRVNVDFSCWAALPVNDHLRVAVSDEEYAHWVRQTQAKATERAWAIVAELEELPEPDLGKDWLKSLAAAA